MSDVTPDEAQKALEEETKPQRKSRHKEAREEIVTFENKLKTVIEDTRQELTRVQTRQSDKESTCTGEVEPASEQEQIDRREKIIRYYARRRTRPGQDYITARSYLDQTARTWTDNFSWEDVYKLALEADNLSFTLGPKHRRLRELTKPSYSHQYDVSRKFSEDIVYDFYRIEDFQEDFMSKLIFTRGPALPEAVVKSLPDGGLSYVESSFYKNPHIMNFVKDISVKSIDELNQETYNRHRRSTKSSKQSDAFDDGTWDIQIKRNSRNTGSVLSVYNADKKVLAGIESLEIKDPPMVDDRMITALEPYEGMSATSWKPYYPLDEPRSTKDRVDSNQAVTCMRSSLRCL